MNEITINSAISRLHFIIVSIFVFIFSSLFLVTLSVYNGIEIQSLKLLDLNIKQLYIKWDEKLVIKADDLEITTGKKSDSDYKKNLKSILYILKNSNEFSELIKEIDLKKISLNDINASFKYKIGENGFVTLRSNNIDFNCSINANRDSSTIIIDKFENSSNTITSTGQIIIDNLNENLAGKFNINLYDDAKLKLYIYLDQENLLYRIDSDKKIDNLQKILKLFPIPEYVDPWIYDAVQISDTEINNLHGYIEFSKSQEIIKNIYADINLSDVNYTFDKRLAPIQTSSTNLVFKEGILHIYPKDGTFHNQKLKNSYLDIDLYADKTVLTVYLRDYLTLDRDMLNLLKTYNIDIPFMQTSSQTDTSLDIAVKLASFNVDVNGTFKVKNADFLYNNLPLTASDGFISLNGAFVDIKKLQLSYKDKIKSDVTGYLNPVKETGKIKINVKSINFDPLKLASTSKKTKLNLVYKASPLGDTIDVSESSWMYGNNNIKMNSFDLKFDFKSLFAKLSTVQLSVDNKFDAYLSGNIDLKNITADLDLDILKLDLEKVKLDQTVLPVSIKYKNKIEANVGSKSIWKLDNERVILNPTKIVYDNNYIKLMNDSIVIRDKFSSDFDMAYDTDKKIGYLSLSNVDIKNDFFKGFVDKDETYHIKIDNSSEDKYLFLDKYALKMLFKENNQWMLSCDDINKIYKYVPYFKDYNITAGSFDLSSSDNDAYLFDANLTSSYQFLVKDNVPIDNYRVKGKYKQNNTDIFVNDDLHVNIKKDIKIGSNALGFNIPEIIRFNNEHKSEEKNRDLGIITLEADNSYLYFKDNKQLLADHLELQYLNSEITAQLKYKSGSAGFNLNRFGIFYLYGLGFDDKFMEKLFSTSKFSGGSLSFTINGAVDDFSGIIEIEKTTLKDYKVLNNVFAFVNTIPSLVTFNLPDYSKDGLKVDNMYVGFTSKNSIYDLTDISLTSKEIKIYGKGKVDLNTENLDLDLNLKTDLGSKASQIPVVGYILFDKDSISTSLKVTGNMYDPKVSTTIAKDIAVAPLNIIKRTLLLPVELMSPQKQ